MLDTKEFRISVTKDGDSVLSRGSLLEVETIYFREYKDSLEYLRRIFSGEIEFGEDIVNGFMVFGKGRKKPKKR